MKIISNSLYQIDHVNSKVISLPISNDNEDLKDYLKELLEKISFSDSKRKFEFERNTTEVKKLIDEIMEGADFNKSSEMVAFRLLKKEQDAQKDIQQLMYEIQKGVLVLALLDEEGVKKIIISKADHSDYIDEEQLKRRKGLPIKKKIYKALLVEYGRQNEIKEIFVYDTNTNIARYWWSDFLELSEVRTDEQNTDNAFDSVDKGPLARIKKDYSADHNILRNRILGYFKSNKTFEIEDFIENAIGSYDPVDSRFNVDDFKKKIKELPGKKGFDGRFTITPQLIKARTLRNIIPLNEKMDLHIKEYIPDMNEVIEAVKIKGEKYIRIKTDSGFEAFKKN